MVNIESGSAGGFLQLKKEDFSQSQKCLLVGTVGILFGFLLSGIATLSFFFSSCVAVGFLKHGSPHQIVYVIISPVNSTMWLSHFLRVKICTRTSTHKKNNTIPGKGHLTASSLRGTTLPKNRIWNIYKVSNLKCFEIMYFVIWR